MREPMNKDAQHLQANVVTIYERVGGDSFFTELINRFYERVEDDPILRPLYPEDLEPGKARLAAFLVQYWGGPDNYSQERGHPRLRQRHIPFPIGKKERDAWVAHMLSALESMKSPEYEAAQMREYFQNTATLLINRVPKS